MKKKNKLQLHLFWMGLSLIYSAKKYAFGTYCVLGAHPGIGIHQ